MMKYTILLFSFCLLNFSLYAKDTFTVDFTKKTGNAFEWLKNNDYEPKQDAEDLQVSFESGKLVIESTEETFGFFGKKIDELDATHMRIEWGVDQYPEGADWDQEIRREAIAVIVSFGTEKINSGSWVVPNVPYFISFFLEKNAQNQKLYQGQYFKKGGRYYCTPCAPPTGSTVTTEVDLSALFEESFGTSIRPITAIAIEVDTTDTNGKSKAFIKTIEFFKK